MVWLVIAFPQSEEATALSIDEDEEASKRGGGESLTRDIDGDGEILRPPRRTRNDSKEQAVSLVNIMAGDPIAWPAVPPPGGPVDGPAERA
jgi:hypothetical protein